MTTKDRLIKLVFAQIKPEVDEERIKQLLDQEDPHAEVDWDEVTEALGFSSLQALEFLKSVNAEFGKDLTVDEFMSATGTEGLLALLD